MSASSKITDPWEVTPVERSGDYWLKRDDLFEIAGCAGGKVRSCWALAQGATLGLVTGSSRISPQQQIVSRIAKQLGVPCRVHTATGGYTTEMLDAVEYGAEMFQHKMGYSATLAAKARKDTDKNGWTLIPFGMESPESIRYMRNQVTNLPRDIKRLVIIVGSGISCCGVLWGLRDIGLDVPVVGIRVGGGVGGNSIIRRMNRFAPCDWSRLLTIHKALVPYHKALTAQVNDVDLDEHYESKARSFLQPDDLFWVIGRRPYLQT